MRPFLVLCILSSVVSGEEWVRRLVAAGFPSNTAIAFDFTGDGKVDVVANDAQGKEDILFVAPDWKRVVLRSNADGVFHYGVADADGDGDPDVIGSRYSPGFLYWLERPKEPLAQPWKMHVIDDSAKGGIDGIHGLFIADVNGDKKADIVANSAQPKGAFANSIVWYEAPKFERRVFARGDAPGLSHYMGVGDVNGDGLQDISGAAKVAEGGNWFAWWEQPRNGTLPWKKHVVAEKQEGASNILMADVNKDGKMDFIASRGHGKGLLWFEGPKWVAHDIDTGHVYPHSLAVGDIDRDGDVDAVTCSAVYNGSVPTGVAWFENDGKGKFKTHLIAARQASYDTRLADMDGDGDLDVLVAGQDSRNVVWFENRIKNPK